MDHAPSGIWRLRGAGEASKSFFSCGAEPLPSIARRLERQVAIAPPWPQDCQDARADP